MRTIAEQWSAFESAVLHGAPPIQCQEMRRAFYAGFHSALMSGIEMAGESKDNDDIGATMMDNLHKECLRFVEDLNAGRA